jgi:hypothetical protein
MAKKFKKYIMNIFNKGKKIFLGGEKKNLGTWKRILQ